MQKNIFILILLLPVQVMAIEIVGSSTVYPFSTVAAELFAQATSSKAPKVESTGSGGGMKLFCRGTQAGTPDIANTSRRIKKSEQQFCSGNGVSEVMEVKIGYDGIVIAQSISAQPFKLSRQELFLALAGRIPAGEDKVTENISKTWNDIALRLPKIPIQIYGPPPTSGTRDAFVELVMEKACAEFPYAQALKKKNKQQYKALCHGVREDGAYIEAGENDNLIIQKLEANPQALGIFGFSFLEENRDKVRGLDIENQEPTFDAIADGSYSVSRPLFFYVKLSRYDKTPKLKEFVEFFISEDIMGEDGALADRGLIPLPAIEYTEITTAIKNRRAMPIL